MGEVTLSRAEVEKLKVDDRLLGGGDRVASFLAHKFDEEDARQRAAHDDEPTWVYNIWTYRF